MTEEVEELKKKIEALNEDITELKRDIERLQSRVRDKLDESDLEYELRMLGIIKQNDIIEVLCKKIDEIVDNMGDAITGFSISERLKIDAHKNKKKRR
tara:strand:+ start:161 stop:454 length:294 start_codon:yes stop_codon:yes gene_type:complete